MSTLREMAQAVAKSLNEEVDFFLVVRDKVPNPKTGQKPLVVATNVGKNEVADMANKGTERVILKRLADARGKQWT